VPTMVAEFDAFVRTKHPDASLKTIVVPEAMARLRQGDAETHNRLLAERAPELDDRDALMLAHFSTSLAADAVRAKVRPPVLSAPQSAVMRMRGLIER
jgi:hypothetical protein